MSLQLPLSVHLNDNATFANFFIGDNYHVIDVLQKFCVNAADPYIYLCGSAASGKSHLLQACCHAVSEQNKLAIYLPLSEVSDMSPDLLMGMEQLDLICLDDIDAVFGNRDWEEALFHLYNKTRELKTRLLIAGSNVPSKLNCLLPDLRSRLTWGLIFQLQMLSDEQKLSALKKRAELRGLELNTEVGQYLLRHYARDMGSLSKALEHLDKASLIAQRRLTIPFVKETLAI